MALATAYNSGALSLADASTDFAADACYAILVNGYTFSAAHTAYSDVSASELSTAGDYERVALAGKAVSIVSGKIRYNSNDISFGDPVSIGPTDGIVILKGTAATPNAADPLLFYAPLADLQSTTAVFSVGVPNGIYEVTIA